MMFVGECRSLTAKRKNWTWKDGRLAAKPLFEALAAMGVDVTAHDFSNLWTDASSPIVPWQRVQRLKKLVEEGTVVVALGKRVSAELAKRGIEHVALVHPAARGKIRKRERYHKHVREKLTPALSINSAFCELSVPFGPGTQKCDCHGVSTASTARAA